jgi:hypothetical protein
VQRRPVLPPAAIIIYGTYHCGGRWEDKGKRSAHLVRGHAQAQERGACQPPIRPYARCQLVIGGKKTARVSWEPIGQTKEAKPPGNCVVQTSGSARALSSYATGGQLTQCYCSTTSLLIAIADKLVNLTPDKTRLLPGVTPSWLSTGSII